MAREYVIPMNGATLANNSPVTLVFFQTSNTAPVVAVQLIKAAISQAGSTTSAMIRANLSTQVSSFPTLTSATPQPLKSSDPAAKITGGTAGAAGTAGVNASAEGAGSKTVLIPDSFNNLNGFLWVPTPDEVITESAQATAHGFGLNLPTAPSSLTLWSAYLIYREIG